MLKTTFEFVKEEVNKDEIALYNIKNSIEFFNEQSLYHSSLGWILNDGTRNFEKLELMYRENNFNAHVIPVKVALLENFKITLYNENNLEYAFEVKIGHVFENDEQYKENFEKLKKVGYVDMIDTTAKKLDTNEQRLERNEIILCFTKMTAKESIEHLKASLTEELGYKPKIEVIGTFREDVPLMGFKTKDNKYASNICWFMLKNDNNEYEYHMKDINEFIAKN